jgi:DNA polymerase I-like protein with 3'-5' exonuclease and polymerase domains
MHFATNILGVTEDQAIEILHQPSSRIGVDIETVSLDNRLPLGVAVAIDKDRGFYFWDTYSKELKRKIEETTTAVFHNAAYDIPLLHGLRIGTNGFEDSMLKAYSCGILDKGLQDLSQSILHKEHHVVTELWEGRSAKQKAQGNIAINHVDLANMSISHACHTLELFDKLPNTELYNDIDRPIISLVMEMEKWGLLVDQLKLTEVEQAAVVKASDMKRQLLEGLGDVNLGSNPQVAEALQARGILGTRKTRGGADAVSEESLKPLNHPLTNMLLEWRSEMKTLSTYVPAFRKPDTNGRIHTEFGYVRTGRFSSSDPNLQNITRGELRKCFISEPGYTFISLDASQIELRVVAILSQDPLLLEALSSTDLHLATAIQVFGWTDDAEEMARRRYNAKQLNFAVLYGADEWKVAEMAGVPVIEARQLIQSYFGRYVVLKQWIDRIKRDAKEGGYVTNLFNRIRPIPDIQSGLRKLQEKAEREAVNTVVQGTAADIIKMMMIYLRSIIDPSIRMVLQVHDEIVLEVPDELLMDTLVLSKELKQGFPDYPVKAQYGKCYGTLEDYHYAS